MRPRSWWRRVLVRAGRVLPAPLRYPEALLDRLRWLFLAFAQLVYAIAFVAALAFPGAGVAARLVAAAAVVAVSAWAYARYLGHLAGFFPDLVPPLSLGVLGWVLQTDLFALPLAFTSMLFHATYGTLLLTAAKVVHYIAAVEVSLARAPDVVLGFTPQSITNVVVLVAITVVMRMLRQSLKAHATRARYEEVLSAAGQRLLSARRVEDIHATAATAARTLLDDPAAVVSVWRREDEDYTPVRVEHHGAEVRLSTVQVDDFPQGARQRLRRGDPHVVGVELSRRLYERFGLDYAGETVVVVPLSLQATMMGALVLARRASAGPPFLDVLRRFGVELSLALERVEAMERLGDYTHELQVANRRLRRAGRVKDDFLANVTHELRTPLTAIAGFADTLINRWDHLNGRDARRFVRIIQRHAVRQQRLVDDLLMVTRLQAEVVDPRRVEIPLRDLVLDVVAELSREVDSVTVQAPGDVTGWADPDHIARILINLLTNAAKYGAPPIEVHAPVPLPDEPAEIRVVDHGPGIDDDFLPRLFSRFEQASSGDSRSSSGVGLGLSISRELARRNGGDLRHEATPGGGATFVVSLPQHAAVTAEERSHLDGSEALERS